MSIDRAIATGVLGGPPRPAECEPATGRPYEEGSGALSRAEQALLFAREAAIAADMPLDGEVCSQTGRKFEIGAGALPKSLQTARFLDELPPEVKAQRQANANALAAIEPKGTA